MTKIYIVDEYLFDYWKGLWIPLVLAFLYSSFSSLLFYFIDKFYGIGQIKRKKYFNKNRIEDLKSRKHIAELEFEIQQIFADKKEVNELNQTIRKVKEEGDLLKKDNVNHEEHYWFFKKVYSYTKKTYDDSYLDYPKKYKQYKTETSFRIFIDLVLTILRTEEFKLIPLHEDRRFIDDIVKNNLLQKDAQSSREEYFLTQKGWVFFIYHLNEISKDDLLYLVDSYRNKIITN